MVQSMLPMLAWPSPATKVKGTAWAISVPTRIQCSAPTLAQRGVGYGMDCIQVDGNDLFAVVKVVREAAERARTTNRPTFIEAITYRLGDHTTADDARRYRDQEEVEMWKLRDPLIRLRNHLDGKGLWDETRQAALLEQAEAHVVDVVKSAVEIEPLPASDMFANMYKAMPAGLEEQARAMRTCSLGRFPGETVDQAAT